MNASRVVRHTILCFILFALILGFKMTRGAAVSDGDAIHAGILRDLTAEMPSGRQALVSSLSVMPLSSLAALPFLVFLKPAAYGFAYLYGLAVLLALSALPLRALLRHRGLPRLGAAAPVLLALAAAGLGSTPGSDLLAALAMLILTLFCETRKRAELRALAGIFWALLLLAHVAGLLLVAGRLAWLGVDRLRRVLSPETRAVRWIQATTILYGFAVYLFLNWMIMGSAAYPFVTAPWWRLAAGDADGAEARLAGILAKRYSDCRPVVSGVWGYAVQPLLDAAEGYHVVDFHLRKLPPDETGALVLVIPAGDNPFARLNDAGPEFAGPEALASPPVVERTDEWIFVRLELKTVEPD